jgi:hypothetical protein
MPFTALRGDEVVWPDEVTEDSTLNCVNCGSEMHVRAGHTTQGGVLMPRCFAHNPNANAPGCAGGESDTHKIMKYVAERHLSELFDGQVRREWSPPETDRIGDVVVEFGSADEKMGHGAVVEAQHRNDSKDKAAVTSDYLQAGYSVYWISDSDFGPEMKELNIPSPTRPWPNAVPLSDAWTPALQPVDSLSDLGSTPDVTVKLPPDFISDNRSLLRAAWSWGNGSYEFDLVYKLSEHNADRDCAKCAGSASHYFFADGSVSTFRCDDHLPRPAAEVAE